MSQHERIRNEWSFFGLSWTGEFRSTWMLWRYVDYHEIIDSYFSFYFNVKACLLQLVVRASWGNILCRKTFGQTFIKGNLVHWTSYAEFNFVRWLASNETNWIKTNNSKFATDREPNSRRAQMLETLINSKDFNVDFSSFAICDFNSIGKDWIRVNHGTKIKYFSFNQLHQQLTLRLSACFPRSIASFAKVAIGKAFFDFRSNYTEIRMRIHSNVNNCGV